LLLSSCGFHLRGTGATQLPEALSRLRVVAQDSKLAHDPLLVAMKEALRTQGGASIVETAGVPTLILSGENTGSDVLAVGAAGKVSAYLLRYEVTFHVRGADGKELLAAQTVRLRRDYVYDPLNVLAKEREEQELTRALRQDAVQQIVRRLAKASLKPQASSPKPEAPRAE
jgi:LPS-assembly lipoprotein